MTTKTTNKKSVLYARVSSDRQEKEGFFMGKTVISLAPLLYAGVFYLVFNGILTLLFGFIEKKMAFYKE